MIGTTISKYLVLDVLGEGGMGVVYRARDEQLGRTVALKFLPPALTKDDAARARFLNEARAASALDHRNVCTIYDIGETDDGQMYIIMPCYSGESLAERIDRGPLDPVDAVEVLSQVCTGLVRAHEKEILHRDLKPANVFLTQEGDVKILDFGVAKLADDATMTKTGGLVGTLAYMAPEQLHAESASVQSEIWSLGAILWEMLRGEAPFRRVNQAATVTAILHDPLDLGPFRTQVGDELCTVLRNCLRRRPELRYASVAELLGDLEGLRMTSGSAVGIPRGDGILAEDVIPTQDLLSPSSRSAGGPRKVQPKTASPASSSVRPFSSIVGRQEELEILRDRLQDSLSGRPRIALIRGEEGRGKSTLVSELCSMASKEGNVDLARGACTTRSGGDPFLPFREILLQLAGQRTMQEPAKPRARTPVPHFENLAPEVVELIVDHAPDLVGTFVSGTLLLEWGRTQRASGSWFGRLESLVRAAESGERTPQRAVLFDQYLSILQRLAAEQPLLLVVEDLHWADEGSVSLLLHLAGSLGSSPVFIVGTFRYEEVTLVPGRERHALESALHELARELGDVEIDLDGLDGRHFVDAIVDSEPNGLDREFRDRLFQHTGGLPLFTTELLRELSETGVLVPDGEGRWTASREVDWELVPRRVEAVVAERLARLPEDLRAILTAASVQGEEFVAAIVAKVLQRNEREVVRSLSNEAGRRYRVVTATGVRHVGAHRQLLYRFRHALFQRYLYESLDHVERALLHEDTATAMEAAHAERDDEVVALLAHHYREAGITEKAIACLGRAAERAAHMSAHVESIRLYEAALEEVERLPAGDATARQELRLRMALASAQIAVHGFGSEEVEATYLRARELCERLPEASDFPLLWGLFAFSSVRGEFERSLPLARRMLAASPKGSEVAHRVQSLYAAGISEFFVGRLDAALEHLREAAEPRDPELGKTLSLAFAQDSRRVAAAYASWVLWLRGDSREALEAARDVIRVVRQESHPFTLSTVLFLTGFVRVLAGHVDEARAQANEIERLSEEYEIFQAVEARLLRALADTSPLGDGGTTALERLDGAIAEFRGRQWSVFVPFFLERAARARAARGDVERAAKLLDEAEEIARKGGEVFWLGEILRLRSELSKRGEAATD